MIAAALLTLHSIAWPQGQDSKEQNEIQELVRVLDSTASVVMTRFNVPGMALTVVRDGRPVIARGYGVRRLGRDEPVDDKTLFGIASNTKAFTATALGLLVEEGKISWDGKVIDYLPGFAVAHPYVTRELTIRDLLVHRSGLGLGAGDLLWWPPTTYTRKEIARRIRFVPLETSFRSTYAYDNILYLAAGEVIEAVSGVSWEDFIRTRILAPVGMTTTVPNITAADGSGNVAGTHAELEGEVRAIKPFASDNTNPAGGIMSNAADMAKWMVVMLDSGRLGEKRLFSPSIAAEMWKLVTPLPIGTPPPELTPARVNFNGYGLGFVIRDYRGEKILTHTGGLPGYLSRVTMVPALKLGVSVLLNTESGAAFNAMTNSALDLFMLPGTPASAGSNRGPAKHDWIGAYTAVLHRSDSATKAADRKQEEARNADSRPSLTLEKYAGLYRDKWYGDVRIDRLQEKGDGLTVTFLPTPALVGDLVHWQYDTFVARWHDRELRADAFMTFSLNPDGSIEAVRMKAVSPSTDFSFDFHDLDLRPLK